MHGDDGVHGGAGFDAGVAPWAARLGLARDAVRQQLVARQLRAHVPDPSPGGSAGRVLDVGCGQGDQAVRLARRGHRVVGVDRSRELLDLADATADAERPEVRARLRFVVGDLFDVADRTDLGGPFDLVCCHGVVMYLPALDGAVAALASAVAPGGVLSLLSRNRAGIAMRAGLTGDWAGAVAGFDATHYANRLGIEDVRADDPAAVAGACEAAGLDVAAWYGVRLFTDHWGDVAPPDDLDAVIAAEEEAGRRDPYRGLAALTHTIARRPA